MNETSTTMIDEPLFTNFQARFLSFLPLFSASPSWIGSGLIIYVILRERTTLLSKTYHRLMLGLSVVDFIFSFRYVVFAGTWSIPEDLSLEFGRRGARSFVPCSIEGFLGILVIGSVLYTSSLMVYFVLILHFEISFDFVARRVEPVMHFVSIVVPVMIGAIAASNEMINPIPSIPGSCFLLDYPPDCSFDDNVECKRKGDGNLSFTLNYIIATLVLLALVFIVVAMVLLILKVKQTEEKMRRYAGGALSRSSMMQTRKTAVRGLLYVLAFFLFAAPTINVLTIEKDYSPENRMIHLTSALFYFILSTNQGLFNAVIYLNPRFQELTAENGTLSFLRPLVNFVRQFRCCVILFTCSCCHALCCCCGHQAAPAGLQGIQVTTASVEHPRVIPTEMQNHPSRQQDNETLFSTEDKDEENPPLQDKNEENPASIESFINEEQDNETLFSSEDKDEEKPPLQDKNEENPASIETFINEEENPQMP